MDNERDFMLTTIDNPFNPFTHFDEWYKFDMTKGYDTCGYLGKIVSLSNNLSDDLNEDEIEMAMKQIVETEPNFYMIVNKNGENVEEGIIK